MAGETSSTRSTFGDGLVEQQDLLLVGRLKNRCPPFKVSPCHRRGCPFAPTHCDVQLARLTPPRAHRGNAVRLPPPKLAPRVASHPVQLAPSGHTPKSRSGPGRGDPGKEPTADVRDALEILHPTNRRPVESPTRPYPT